MTVEPTVARFRAAPLLVGAGLFVVGWVVLVVEGTAGLVTVTAVVAVCLVVLTACALGLLRERRVLVVAADRLGYGDDRRGMKWFGRADVVRLHLTTSQITVWEADRVDWLRVACMVPAEVEEALRLFEAPTVDVSVKDGPLLGVLLRRKERLISRRRPL